MDRSVPFERLLAFDRWANGEALASVERLATPSPAAVETLAHLLGAEMCWIVRMTEGREAPGIEHWDTQQTLATLRTFWETELPALWTAFLADPSLSDPRREFTFVDFLGRTSRPTRVEDVLLLLVFHSAHHRGQVATAVRAAGGEPAATEFLRAARAGAV